MKILRLSSTGIDRVTFWTSPEKPEGCLLYYKGEQACYAVAAITKDGKDKPEVGLLLLHLTLYNYLIQELQGRSISEFDFDFVSSHSEIFILTLSGGRSRLDDEMGIELDALEKRIQQPGAHEEIRAALYRLR